VRRFAFALFAVVVLIGTFAVPLAAAEGGAAPPAAAAPAVLDAREKALAGNVAGAIADLAPYVEATPSDLAAARLLGDLYYRVPDLANAERVYLAIVKRAPDDRDTHTRLGGLYAAMDRVSEAIAEFEKSLPVREGYAGLVELHRRRGDLEIFARELQIRADANRLDPIAQSNYANVLRAERRYAESLPYFERQLFLRPGSCIALNEYGNALIDNERLKEAIGVLERCLAHDDSYYPALVNVGEAYIEMNRLDKAQASMEHALRVKPDGAEALIDLGYIEDTGGRWRQAIGYYQRAIAVDPLAREAYIDLGYDYNERQLYPLAEASFLRGLSVVPNDGRLNYLLAVTYAVQGKTLLARVQYRKALASDERDVVRAATNDLALLK
jgi:tetratricopeptide (TPR) repeat protein